MIEKQRLNIKGMQVDIDNSKAPEDKALYIKNLRFTGKENETLGLTSEQGPLLSDINYEGSITGTPLGNAVIDKYVAIFTHEEEESPNPDHIYRLDIDPENEEKPKLVEIYSGNLNFKEDAPIDTIVYRESENVTKVYWIDNNNQPRVINIAHDPKVGEYNDKSFDFIREIKCNETISVTKNYDGQGLFSAGTIQYAFTYLGDFNQETNIFDFTPLNYISNKGKANSSDDTISNSFTIEINNVDTTFNYVRIYSIFRGSINSTPYCKKVVDIPINKNTTLKYTDNNIGGEAIAPMDIKLAGGQVVSIGTFEQKDNVLFMGDIKKKNEALDTERVKSLLKNVGINIKYKSLPIPDNHIDDYHYTNQLSFNSREIKYFKKGEVYRLGVQLQNEYGEWSNVVYITTVYNNEKNPIKDNDGYQLPYIEMTGVDTASLKDMGYINIRPVVSFLNMTERNVLCQGIVNPTLFNVDCRVNNRPFSQASWFFRPDCNKSVENKIIGTKRGKFHEFRHYHPLPDSERQNAELQNSNKPSSRPVIVDGKTKDDFIKKNSQHFYVDRNICTLNSPELDYDDELINSDYEGIKFKLVGIIPIDTTLSDMDIQSKTPTKNYNTGFGKNNAEKDNPYEKLRPIGFKKPYEKFYEGNCLGSGPYWRDSIEHVNRKELYKKMFYPIWDERITGAGVDVRPIELNYIVYPWHRDFSLNNTQYAVDNSVVSAELKRKVMTNLRFSNNSIYFNNAVNMEIETPELWISDELEVIKITNTSCALYTGNVSYYGNVDYVSMYTNIDTGIHGYPISFAGFSTGDNTFDVIHFGDWGENYYYSFYPKVSGSTKSIFNIDDLYDWFETSMNDKTDATNVYLYSTLHDGGTGSSRYSWKITKDNEKLFFETIFDSFSSEDRDYKKYETMTSKHPLRIKYKSGRHYVFMFKDDELDCQNILPSINGLNNVNDNSNITEKQYFWLSEKVLKGISQHDITDDSIGSDIRNPYLFIAEFYRDRANNLPTDINHWDETVDNSFDGWEVLTEDKLQTLEWLPANSATELNGDILEYVEGDTYYQRYNCLKTYPFDDSATNNIIDICSCMIESRINIDGRYDKNIDQYNIYINNSNYGLVNSAYSQPNNFFSGVYVNNDYDKVDNYNDYLTWSMTKIPGETIDKWTNITLANTLNIKSDTSGITKLINFNDDLIAICPDKVYKILFNENQAITTTDGVPIQIANSGKVTGALLLKTNVGTANKWGVVKTENNVYFYDEFNKDIYGIISEFPNLTLTNGMHNAVKNWSKGSWTIKDNSIVKAIWDKKNKDVLFLQNNVVLAYSEIMQTFTSYYDYMDPYLINIQDRHYWLHRDGTSDQYMLWNHNEGRYCNFFGTKRTYEIDNILNGGEHVDYDKTFYNIEFIADYYDSEDYNELKMNNNTNLAKSPFNQIKVENEYQSTIDFVNLIEERYKPTNTKEKFSFWRFQIPRDTKNGRGLNRFRNTWIKTKLVGEIDEEKITEDKVHIHNINYSYII